jgi:hypothetical protein
MAGEYRRETRPVRSSCYNQAVTAKQALLELVESMSEEDAEELLSQLEQDGVDYEPLTAEEEAQLNESKAAFDAGDFVSADEYFKRLDL